MYVERSYFSVWPQFRDLKTWKAKDVSVECKLNCLKFIVLSQNLYIQYTHIFIFVLCFLFANNGINLNKTTITIRERVLYKVQMSALLFFF